MFRKILVFIAVVCLLSVNILANDMQTTSGKSISFSEEEREYMSRPEVKEAIEKRERLAELHYTYRIGELSEKDYTEALVSSGYGSEYIDTALRIAPFESFDAQGNSSKASAAYIQNSVGVSHVTQQNSYFCGPASAYIAIKYNVPSFSGTQSSLASSLIYYDAYGDPSTPWNIGYNSQGVLVYPMRNTLNQFMYVPWYLAMPIDNTKTVAALKADIVSTIDSGYPVVGNIYGVQFNGYYTPGHWIVIKGYKDSGDTITIVDPAYGQLAGAQSATFDVSIGTLHYALLGRGIIW